MYFHIKFVMHLLASRLMKIMLDEISCSVELCEYARRDDSQIRNPFQRSDLAFLSRQKVIRTESTLASRHRLAFDSAFTTPRGGGSFKSASANSKYSRGVTGKGIGTLLNEFESNLASSLSSTSCH